jgi:DNA-directed RNA polymerase beta subunit
MTQSIVNISSLINTSWHHIHISLWHMYVMPACIDQAWNIYNTLVHFLYPLLYCKQKRHMYVMPACIDEAWNIYNTSQTYVSFVYNKVRGTENGPKYYKYFKPHQCKLASQTYVSFVYNKIRGTENELWCQLALIRLEIFTILWSIFCTPYFIVNKWDICMWCQPHTYVSFVYNKIRSTENEPKYCKYFKPDQCKLASHTYISFVYNKIRGTENGPKYCKYFKPHQCKLPLTLL